ncbi:MAG: Lrp/AsnC family transcriptional regulator [Betaproteobacteria bacterium]
MTTSQAIQLDMIDRAIIQATQTGLPLSSRPYHTIAEQIAIAPEVVMQRMQAMLDNGVIRRIGAVPNHYSLGWNANGMTVWDVTNEQIDALGQQVGALEFVSHCYRRPRLMPGWPYNLFAMVHGRDRDEVAAKKLQIAELLGEHCRASDTLYSTQILKKTGLRI